MPSVPSDEAAGLTAEGRAAAIGWLRNIKPGETATATDRALAGLIAAELESYAAKMARIRTDVRTLWRVMEIEQ